jgi:hypothetical protein
LGGRLHLRAAATAATQTQASNAGAERRTLQKMDLPHDGFRVADRLRATRICGQMQPASHGCWPEIVLSLLIGAALPMLSADGDGG